MSRASAETRLALLRAAERLFAQSGVDAVSFRQIAAEAGQKNHAAVAYHFSDKKALIDAVLSRHSDPIQASWLATLEHLAAEDRNDLDELVGLLVRPLVAKLDDPDGGTNYLLVVAQLIASRTFPISEMPATMEPGILALVGQLMGHMEAFPSHLMPLRMMRVTAALYCSIADYHRLSQLGLSISREEFTADLIASLVALLGQRATSA